MAIFVSFNCQGLGSHLKFLELLSQFKNKTKETNCVIALQETKIERLSSNHQAILTRYKMQFIIETSVKKLCGLLLPVAYHWKIDINLEQFTLTPPFQVQRLSNPFLKILYG